MTLLGAIIVWILKEGILITKLGVELILYSSIVSFSTNLINASILRTIVDTYHGELSFLNALHLSALGTFGNSAGGLPIGTTLKYIILHKRSGLNIKQITAGLIVFTVVISYFLLAYASISAWYLHFPHTIKWIPTILFLVSILFLLLLWKWLRNKGTMVNLINPFLSSKSFYRLLINSFAVSTLFLIGYLIVGYILFPSMQAMVIVFVSSVGLLAGLASLLQTVGGVHEFSMGFSAFISGTDLLDGVQLALTMRIASVLSSGLILSIFYLFPSYSQKE